MILELKVVPCCLSLSREPGLCNELEAAAQQGREQTRWSFLRPSRPAFGLPVCLKFFSISDSQLQSTGASHVIILFSSLRDNSCLPWSDGGAKRWVHPWLFLS